LSNRCGWVLVIGLAVFLIGGLGVDASCYRETETAEVTVVTALYPTPHYGEDPRHHKVVVKWNGFDRWVYVDSRTWGRLRPGETVTIERKRSLLLGLSNGWHIQKNW
jgi:hypothetical protein